MDITHILYSALEAEHGIEFVVSDAETFKRRFYQIRAKLRKEGCEDFESLTCRVCPTDPQSKMWIVRNTDRKVA